MNTRTVYRHYKRGEIPEEEIYRYVTETGEGRWGIGGQTTECLVCGAELDIYSYPIETLVEVGPKRYGAICRSMYKPNCYAVYSISPLGFMDSELNSDC